MGKTDCFETWLYRILELLSRVERKLQLPYLYSEHLVFKALVSTSEERHESGRQLGKV